LQGPAKILFLNEGIFKLEHWQNQETNRSGYLRGLAVDCYKNPGKDRNSHYFARELMYCNRFLSAIKEFARHIAMNKWPAERAQSMIHVGDCYGYLNQPFLQAQWYSHAFACDSSRREALVKLARFHSTRGEHQAAICYATAALEIPNGAFYANNVAHYTHEPHEILYAAKGWVGDIKGAQQHLLKALSYQPCNPTYLRDTKFYFEYPDQGIDGWMSFEELQWLYETAKQVSSIAEIGCWKGRSTHALASGTKGIVTAIDHWKGSEDVRDSTNWMAKQEDVLSVFKHNLRDRGNVVINQNDGSVAAKQYPAKNFDMVFIDAGHTYEDVKRDIANWLPKTKFLICGDDYMPDIWMGVCQAVDEAFGKPDGVVGKIWYKFIGPKISFVIPTLGRPEGLKRCLDSIENLVYPKGLVEVIVLNDSPRLGVPQRVKEGVQRATGDYIVFGSNDIEFTPHCITEALAEKKGLVAFNTGPVLPDKGNICEHFMIHRDLVQRIGGMIFDTQFHHVGVDNLLWAQCDQLGEAVRSEAAVAIHHHFSKGAPMDPVYEEGWAHIKQDRALLKKKLKALHANS
jgi:tetratricopeptide (TPR) repeat protein